MAAPEIVWEMAKGPACSQAWRSEAAIASSHSAWASAFSDPSRVVLLVPVKIRAKSTPALRRITIRRSADAGPGTRDVYESGTKKTSLAPPIVTTVGALAAMSSDSGTAMCAPSIRTRSPTPKPGSVSWVRTRIDSPRLADRNISTVASQLLEPCRDVIRTCRSPNSQVLVLLEKVNETLERTVLCKVLYMALRGAYGAITT